MFQTVVHQTLEDRGNPENIENHGPFPVLNVKNSYLGAGYYFWDDHIELAHWWGKYYVKKDYVICEGKLSVEKDKFLDLVGSRQDQKYFSFMIEKLGMQNESIGTIIESLKEMDMKPNFKGVFPYKVIRAMDVTSKSTSVEKSFASGKKGMANLAPQIMICLIKKNKVILPEYKIVFPEDYL